jgi:hypothetical protein
MPPRISLGIPDRGTQGVKELQATATRAAMACCSPQNKLHAAPSFKESQAESFVFARRHQSILERHSRNGMMRIGLLSLRQRCGS